MAARIAHEIRNPLTSMSGSIEVLKGDLDLKERDRKLMDIVIRETDRLNQLLTEFLQFAKPQSLTFEQIHLATIIQDTIALFSNSLHRKDLKIKSQLDESILVMADPKQVNQLIWNLLKNASEAMNIGGTIEIILSKESDGNAVIQVTDEGGGVPAELQKKLFSPFFTTKPKGTGLGLAVVKRITEDHHGRVELAQSLPGKTTFQVTLPRSLNE